MEELTASFSDINLLRSGFVELHPMENPVILESIFRHCDCKTLKACRQLSKLWQETSLNAWRSIVKTTLYGEPTTTRFLTVLAKSSSHLCVPFVSNFCIHWYFRQGFSGARAILDLWKACGPHIKELELIKISATISIEFLYWVNKHCPNLESLTIERCSEVSVIFPLEDYEPEHYVGMVNLKSLTFKNLKIYDADSPWLEILRHFPGLETLTLKGSIKITGDLFKSWSELRKRDPSKLKLKNIHAVSLLNPVAMQLINTSNISLESFSLRLYGAESSASLKATLSCHALSLRKINLRRRGKFYDDPNDMFPLPKFGGLDNLTELKLLGRVFKTMTFLKFTPNLQKLVLHDMPSLVVGRTPQADMANVKLKWCRALEIRQTKLKLRDLKSLIGWLPNVDQLTISCVDNCQFSLICEHWSNLLSLNIFGSNVDDSGIIGFDTEEVELAWENLYKIIVEDGRDIAVNPMPITVRRANITQLKYLQSFLMDYLNPRRAPRLRFYSARFGINELQNLKHLCILNNFCSSLEWREAHVKYKSPEKFVTCYIGNESFYCKK